MIDVAGGDKIPRKGGPGITGSDLLVVNKVCDLRGGRAIDLFRGEERSREAPYPGDGSLVT